LTHTGLRDVFRPNLWPNTPDILPEHLQYGGRSVFVTRLILAATLSSNYGIYGPAFENCVSDALPGKEEYADSEKFEIKQWDRDAPGNIRDVIKKINHIRRDNPEFQTTWNTTFHETDNEYFVYYSKRNSDSNAILVVVNLDPFHKQSGWIKVPIERFGLSAKEPYLVHELLSDTKNIWQGERNYIELDPNTMPAAIFRLHRRLRRENDFDYYM
jgi:starch synthase (maltosyl-transferring)